MKTWLGSVSLACCLLLGCQGFVTQSPSVAPEQSTLNGDLIFYVHGWMEDGPRMLENVNVSMVTRKGEVVELGHTDVFGGIALNKKRLSDGVVLIFSVKWFFSGAWRIKLDDLHHFDELRVGLAPFSI